MVDYRNSDETITPFAVADDALDTSANRAECIADRDAAVVAHLMRAALSANAATNMTARAIALDAGISAEELADRFIPIVARTLGVQWCEDEIGFGEVTIGVSRLQAMLRDLGPEWNADQDAHPDASTILLVVPENTFHTLGALVVSGQLRRKGLSVRLLLGGTVENIGAMMAETGFDAVFLSAVYGESLEILRKIIDSIHAVSNQVPPVVIGGTLLEIESDVASRTGADYVTSDVDEAISLCNLRTKPRLATVMEH